MAFRNILEVLSSPDMQRIHDASLKILAETGVVFLNDQAIAIFKKRGVRVDDRKVYFSEKLVREALQRIPPNFLWQARNDDRSIVVGDDNEKLLVQPNFGPVFIHDLESGRRPATLQDFANIIKICQASDVVSLVGASPLEPGDVVQEQKYLYMMYETLKNSDKPVIGMQTSGHKVKQLMDMVEIAMGQRGYLRDHHCIGVGISPQSPLTYESSACETIIEHATHNQIIFFTSSVMAGFSGPMSPIGTVILQNTEIVAGMILAQLVNPGNPTVYSNGATMANMRSGNFTTGSPDTALMHLAGQQMGRDYYRIPVRSMSGMTDAKTINCQAGFETMQGLLTAVLGGAHMIFECLGALDTLMTTSYEKLMIDLEIVSRVMHLREGLDTATISQAVKTIQELEHKGEYIMHPDTLAECRNQWLPTLSDWEIHENWQGEGAEDIALKANRMYKEILAGAPEILIDPDVDKALKTYMHNQLQIS